MPEPIRVLQVFAQMNRGGAETMIMNLYRKIDRSKVQFDFIVHTKEKCSFDDEIISLGGLIYRVPKYTGKNHFQYTKAWRQFFKQHPEYKIIHGHVRSTAAIYIKIARKNHLTSIAHSHSTSSGSGFAAFIKNILQFRIRNVADYYFACSRIAGEWLFGKKTCSKKNFFVINNAIDIEKFTFSKETRLNKRIGFGIEDKFVIGHIGRFSYPKNHEFLIDIYRSVWEKNDKAILILVGCGELIKSIEKKVKDIGLTKNVIFTGVRSDVPELLQAMDVFLFPSLYEGLGIAAVEAQAAGLHTIVSDKIPQEVFITSLVEKEQLSSSPDKWADKVLKYANGYDRVDMSERIIANGYDISENARWLENFYQEI